MEEPNGSGRDDGSGDQPPVVGGHGEYDWSETNPSTAVIEVVAAAANARPLDLDVLYEAVDADALDSVVAGGDGTEVSFCYADHEVTVTGTGTVRARPAD